MFTPPLPLLTGNLRVGREKTQCLCGSLRVYGSRPPSGWVSPTSLSLLILIALFGFRISDFELPTSRLRSLPFAPIRSKEKSPLFHVSALVLRSAFDEGGS